MSSPKIPKLREELSPLVGQRVGFTAQIKKFSYGTYKKSSVCRMVVIRVMVHNAKKETNHLNLEISLNQTTRQVLDMLPQIEDALKKGPVYITGTGEVYKYFRSIGNRHIKTYDYGLRKIKKLNIKELPTNNAS